MTAHYLKPAGKSYTPAAVAFLDTESCQDERDGLEVHTLRLWEAQLVRRRDRRRPGEHLTETGAAAEGVAKVIDGWGSYGENMWLYMHNTTFDLTVTRLAVLLGQLGWELSPRFAIGGDSMWCIFRKGRRVKTVTEDRGGRKVTREREVWAHTLTIADSASLFPCPLADLGPPTGLVKPPLPSDDDTAEAWAARCHADVDIMRAAVLQLMDWWDEQDLGHWTVTGAGNGWQTYKRTLDPRSVVIDHDPGILEWERQAIYGGRRDVFRVGDLPPGRYAEVDLTAAYPTVAASYPLPSRVACKVTDEHRRLALAGRVPSGMLAEVTISTAVARWPCRIGGRVFYPVGRFRTTLAAPDIRAAAEAGALEAVHDGWLFTMTSHLRPWARQVLGWVADKSGTVPGVVRIWAKLVSRAVIGKFAQRGWSTVPYCGPPGEGWSVEPCIDYWAGTRGVITGVNGSYYLSWADQRGEHERPAVLAWIEAHVRTRLGKVISGPFGLGVVQCDTDGVMISHTVMQKLAARLPARWVDGRAMPAGTPEVVEIWNAESEPLTWREKNQFQRGKVHGPQHVVLDGRPRFAGIPRGAWKAGDNTWMARLWPGMLWQAAHGVADGYARPVQPYRVRSTYAAGWTLASGAVRPAEVTWDAEAGNRLLEWTATRWHASGDRLAAEQALWAVGLWVPPLSALTVQEAMLLASDSARCASSAIVL